MKTKAKTRQVLRVLLVSTPHPPEEEHHEQFLKIHRATVDEFSCQNNITSSYYCPEVPYGVFASDYHKKKLEEGGYAFAKDPYVHAFVRKAGSYAARKNIPLRILHQPPNRQEIENLLTLSKGGLSREEISVLKSTPTTNKQQADRADVFLKWITTIAKNARNEKVSTQERKESQEALMATAYLDQAKAVETLLKRSVIKPSDGEIRINIQQGSGHESQALTLVRKAIETQHEAFDVKVHVLWSDGYGNVVADEGLAQIAPNLVKNVGAKTIRLSMNPHEMLAQLAELNKPKGKGTFSLPNPYPDAQEFFLAHERHALENLKNITPPAEKPGGVLGRIAKFFGLGKG